MIRIYPPVAIHANPSSSGTSIWSVSLFLRKLGRQSFSGRVHRSNIDSVCVCVCVVCVCVCVVIFGGQEIIGAKGAVAIAPSLAKLTQLTLLDLTGECVHECGITVCHRDAT